MTAVFTASSSPCQSPLLTVALSQRAASRATGSPHSAPPEQTANNVTDTTVSGHIVETLSQQPFCLRQDRLGFILLLFFKLQEVLEPEVKPECEE